MSNQPVIFPKKISKHQQKFLASRFKKSLKEKIFNLEICKKKVQIVCYILYMYCYYSYYFSVVYRHKSLFIQKFFLWPKSNILIEACYYVNTWPSVLIACQFVLFSSFQCLCLGEFRGETCAWSITPHHTMTKYLPFDPNKYERLGFA